jgi:hypothetical protein
MNIENINKIEELKINIDKVNINKIKSVKRNTDKVNTNKIELIKIKKEIKIKIIK